MQRSVVALARRSASNARSMSSFTLPDLPYDYAALEPTIGADIMELHHSKHHNAYVTNLNVALEKHEDAKAKNDVAGMIAAQSAINFNGGGHINHSIFWENLAPSSAGGGGVPGGKLGEAIDARWGSFDAFKAEFNATTAAVQGSGWGWLVHDSADDAIKIVTRANQDPVTGGLTPLLGIDVWEHAYYLTYKNVRPDYLNAVWDVVNFSDVERRYESVQ